MDGAEMFGMTAFVHCCIFPHGFVRQFLNSLTFVSPPFAYSPLSHSEVQL